MSKKTLIIIISVVTAIIVATITTVLILHNNKKATKVAVAENNISDNNIELEIPTEEPTDEPSDDANKNNDDSKTTIKIASQSKYYIKVNNQMNTVTVYKKEDNGEYKPIKAMVCSTGQVTPRNSTYTIRRKYTNTSAGWRQLFGHGPYKYVYGQYSQWITGDILFHSVPYITNGDKSSLEWYEYNKLGTTCSQGCVRLTCADAKWLFDNCPVGTPVEFYDSADPGPLGKPSFQYISENDSRRGWDPTDPDPANPWRNSTPTPTPTVTPEIPIPEVPATTTPIETPTAEPENPEPTEEPTEIPTENPAESQTPEEPIN